MPSRRLPNTTATVIRTLIAARDAWNKFPTARLISADHWAKLDPTDPAALLNRLLKQAADIPAARAAQGPLTGTMSQAIARLTLHVSHFHQVYDFGVARGEFTAGGRAHYGRDVSATTVPDLDSIPAVLEAGGKIAPGEAARQAGEGTAFIPMARPSAAQVAAVHADALQKHAAAEAAKLFTDTREGELARLIPEARKLALSLINTIGFRLSERADLDAPGRRRIARAWGVVYVNDDDSPGPAGEPTPAPTAP